MTTPKPVVLWTYAPLEETPDEDSALLAAAARYSPRELLPDPRHELFLEVEGVQFGPGEEVRYPPMQERLQRLTTCAQEGPSQQAERCLAHLAALDRSAAVEIARKWSQAELPEWAQPIVAALLKFPVADGLEAYLDGLGLTDQLHLDLAEHEERPITLQELLLQRGRAHVFSLHRREDSVRHDELLRELASLAPGVLDGLLFEQIPPAEAQLEDEDLEKEPAEDLETEEGEEEDFRDYAPAERLVASGGGRRYEASAKGEFALDEDDDFIDAVAVLDFLNALARARGRDVRWVLFDTGGDACVVAAGPASALESLQAQGLIPASSPERIQAFEARYTQ
jgi:hypothetical protein